MYAIIVTGGKQYKVEQGDVIKVELLTAEAGDTVSFGVVMLNNDGKIAVGKEVEKAVVKAEVVKNGKGPKIDIFRYKAKKNERKRQGHRQPYTEVKITEIKA